MLRSRISLALVIVLGTAGLTLVLAQDGAATTNAQLLEKLTALEKRIINLERSLQQKLTSIEKAIQSGGGPSPQLESEAQAAFAKINSLVNKGDYGTAKTEMSTFMTKYGSTNVAKSARRMNAELAVIGKDAPGDWGIEKWLQGESDVDLASDKTTLLVFWEVWCPHCKREVPKLEALYSGLKSDGLQVLGLTKINRSATEESVVAFMEAQKLSYPIAKENGNISTYFNVSGVPAAAVLKDGKVIWRGHPARLSEAMIKGWL